MSRHGKAGQRERRRRNTGYLHSAWDMPAVGPDGELPDLVECVQFGLSVGLLTVAADGDSLRGPSGGLCDGVHGPGWWLRLDDDGLPVDVIHEVEIGDA